MRRGPPTLSSVTSVLLKQLMHRLVNATSFRLPKFLCSLSVLFKRAKNFGSVFPDRLDRRIYKAKFPTHASLLLLFIYFIFWFSYRLYFNVDAQNLPSVHLCSCVVTLPVYIFVAGVEKWGRLYEPSYLPLGSSFFWDVTQYRLVVIYRHFGA
jgi:hypothetical protein